MAGKNWYAYDYVIVDILEKDFIDHIGAEIPNLSKNITMFIFFGLMNKTLILSYMISVKPFIVMKDICQTLFCT